MITRPQCPLDVTLILPPISALIAPYTSTPPPLTILMLLRRPKDIPPMLPSTLVTPHPLCRLPCLPSHSALPPFLQCRPSISAPTNPYASAPQPLTILTIMQCPQDIPLKPLSTLLTPNPLCRLPSLRSLSSQHASNTAPTPASSSMPPTILMLLKHSQYETTMPPPISALTTPYASAPLPHLL
ncbi:hypothetical protein O181_033229 [Austropuccinia psidii MF-1]|uniref:Uncharacterized protein n=1 Tax=Austropuccinia psidii MF-1 TaxID=1389203 RepID=A0A9Q3CYC4_9BASI|nr:hypothetical protein [Austropuccinia psidii MF-1]